ncbi:hypothetical protein H9P43_007341 [Blastocladiella emersonii ATCC 22665]|nr:hypothetical protein H9P43_007341 [Blastocladiella emersonii ATCC 22665]
MSNGDDDGWAPVRARNNRRAVRAQQTAELGPDAAWVSLALPDPGHSLNLDELRAEYPLVRVELDPPHDPYDVKPPVDMSNIPVTHVLRASVHCEDGLSQLAAVRSILEQATHQMDRYFHDPIVTFLVLPHTGAPLSWAIVPDGDLRVSALDTPPPYFCLVPATPSSSVDAVSSLASNVDERLDLNAQKSKRIRHNQVMYVARPGSYTTMLVTSIVQRREDLLAWAAPRVTKKSAARLLLKLKASFGNIVFPRVQVTGPLARALPHSNFGAFGSGETASFAPKEVVRALAACEIKPTWCLAVCDSDTAAAGGDPASAIADLLEPLGFDTFGTQHKIRFVFQSTHTDPRTVWQRRNSGLYRVGFLLTPATAAGAPALVELEYVRMENQHINKFSVATPSALGFRVRQTFRQWDRTTADGSVHNDVVAQIVPALEAYLKANLGVVTAVLTSRRDSSPRWTMSLVPHAIASRIQYLKMYSSRVATVVRGDIGVSVARWTLFLESGDEAIKMPDKYRRSPKRKDELFRPQPTVTRITAHHYAYHASVDSEEAVMNAREFVAAVEDMVKALNGGSGDVEKGGRAAAEE